MALTEMTDGGRSVCFGPQKQGFSFGPRTGQEIEFTPTPAGWDPTGSNSCGRHTHTRDSGPEKQNVPCGLCTLQRN